MRQRLMIGWFLAVWRRAVPVSLVLLFLATLVVRGQDLTAIGVTTLRAVDASLTGSGIAIAQPEAGFPTFEVNTNIQPSIVFTYYGSNGVASTFPNDLGQESSHANEVGSILYGNQGVAPGIGSVANYDANFYETDIVSSNQTISIPVINQSFVNETTTLQDELDADQAFDDWIRTAGVVCVSGAGNSGIVAAPASGYNCIAVGAWGGASAVGPTDDNGRCKPDITAPAGATSFSTPQVTGAAAILRQAGLRGDGGNGTSTLATDPRTIKSLLLNGAVKTSDWTNTTTAPLDNRYGAGILNVYNSWRQMSGGRIPVGQVSSVVAGGAHAPASTLTGGTNVIGWDNTTITSSGTRDEINHYALSIPNFGGVYLATATLTWQREIGSTNIRNLDLFLYRVADGTLVASSQSPVDNVEHLFLTGLGAGEYDLQVMDRASATINPGQRVQYGLAVSVSLVDLRIAPTNGVLALSWPVYPDGQALQASVAAGAGANWTNVIEQTTMNAGRNTVIMTNFGPTGFYRLGLP